MHFLPSVVLLGTLASTTVAAVSCPPGATCKGVTALVASALKNYAPAQTFCSSKFPVPRKTCTSTARPTTITTTVATSTKTTTIATNSVSVTVPAVTITSFSSVTATISTTETDTETDTATETTTVTITVTSGQPNKRAAPTPQAYNSQSKQLSSLKAQASAYVRAVCTCLGKPASTTVTTTPRVTTSVTATQTSSVTASSTATITPTSTVTVTTTVATITNTATTTITVTTTTTSTSTATTTVSPNCGDTGRACKPGTQCINGRCASPDICSSGSGGRRQYDNCDGSDNGACVCYIGVSELQCLPNGASCGADCVDDNDCPDGSRCTPECYQGPKCVVSCSSPALSKRWAAMRMSPRSQAWQFLPMVEDGEVVEST